MGHRVRPELRWARAAAWTLGLAGGLFALDRATLGPGPEPGWVEVVDVEAIPAGAGEVRLPAYLPRGSRWPPAAAWYRVGEDPGWWVAVEGPSGRMWIGSGSGEPPPALGEAAGCLDEGECPEGWHRLSAPLDGGRAIFVVARGDRAEVARVLRGLR